jgi:aminoglycoside phosphotransferase (APT) family kinase protein
VQQAPGDAREGLVHGDFRIGNTLIHDGRLTAVLDWELVYVGDVRFDLGYLALERAAGKHLRRRTELMGTFADRDWFLERYGRLTGEPVAWASLAPFQMLSIMMLLATQITAVWMHAHGQTDDFRMVWARYSFPGLRDDMVRLMAW